MKVCHDVKFVLNKLTWMRAERIWPNGLRYLWTDAFGVVLLASLFVEFDPDRRPLDVYCAYFSHFSLRTSGTTAGERAERRVHGAGIRRGNAGAAPT